MRWDLKSWSVFSCLVKLNENNIKGLVCKEYVWWRILLWPAALETNYKLTKTSRGKTMNQSKSKQWGAVNEVAGEGHAARPPSCHSLLLKETEETFCCLRSNRILQHECGWRPSKIGLLIKRQSVLFVKEREQPCGICTADLGEMARRRHGADVRWTREISKD